MFEEAQSSDEASDLLGPRQAPRARSFRAWAKICLSGRAAKGEGRRAFFAAEARRPTQCLGRIIFKLSHMAVRSEPAQGSSESI
jgi:hypothetical protein